MLKLGNVHTEVLYSSLHSLCRLVLYNEQRLSAQMFNHSMKIGRYNTYNALVCTWLTLCRAIYLRERFSLSLATSRAASGTTLLIFPVRLLRSGGNLCTCYCNVYCCGDVQMLFCIIIRRSFWVLTLPNERVGYF